LDGFEAHPTEAIVRAQTLCGEAPTAPGSLLGVDFRLRRLDPPALAGKPLAPPRPEYGPHSWRSGVLASSNPPPTPSLVGRGVRTPLPCRERVGRGSGSGASTKLTRIGGHTPSPPSLPPAAGPAAGRLRRLGVSPSRRSLLGGQPFGLQPPKPPPAIASRGEKGDILLYSPCRSSDVSSCNI